MEQNRIKDLLSKLRQMKEIPIQDLDPNELTELTDISVNRDLPQEGRIWSLLSQTKNPYAYVDHGVIVKISFAETGRTLQSCMEQYVESELHRLF